MIRNSLKKAIILLVLAVLPVCFLCGCSAEQADDSVRAQGGHVTDDIEKVTFDVEYHRGGRNSRPENTLYSYLFAIENGATTIECDMQMTESGDIVLSHDPFLSADFTRDADGEYISDEEVLDMRTMSLKEIKSYDVAKIKEDCEYYTEHGKTQTTPEHAQIPTIDEFFSLVKKYGNGIQINIETKIYHDIEGDARACIESDDKEFIKRFNEKVEKYGLEDQIILQSFDWQSLVTMKEINPDIRVSALWSQQPSWGRADEYLRPYEEGASPFLAGLDIDDFKGDAVEAAHSLGFDIVSPYCGELTLDMVNEAHEYGMEVIPWNANTREEIETMYNMGVDGIISDNGPLLREIVLSHGETLFRQRELTNSEYHLDEQSTEDGDKGESCNYQIDGITYSLNADWDVDETEKIIESESEKMAYYTIEQDIVDECSSIEERKSQFDADDDGIDTKDIEINGTEALMSIEPVNEITRIDIYFYVDGKEHQIFVEPKYGKEEVIEPYTQELLEGISW